MIPQGQNQIEEDEEDTDYDPLAKYLPKSLAPVETIPDEIDDMDMEDASLDKYTPDVEKIQQTKANKGKKKEYTALETAIDVGQQGVKETLIGAGGAYGDLLELAGLNKESPAREAKNKADFETLEKMDQPGYESSLADIMSLSDDDEIAPSSFRLPTSETLRDVNEAVGGPGEAKTALGRGAARTGKLYGGGLAFGQINPTAAIAGGVAGQTVEELGGGPLAQAAAEIAAMILTPTQAGKKLVGSAKEQVNTKINELRKLGYTDEQITLAINSASKGKKAGFKASKGEKTQQAFEDFAEKSDELVESILRNEISGIEKGTKYVHELASDAYGHVAKEAAGITITNSKPFLNASKKVVDQLENTLGKNPEAQAFIKRISEAAMDATQYPTAEKMMNFYKELNSMGNWLGRSQKDRLISQVKEGIKDTFRSEGKAGKQLADNFEKANKGIQKAYQAEDVFNLVQKTKTAEGIDYKKLKKVFDSPDDVKLMEEVLGKAQTGNLRQIATVGKDIKDFDKAWKATNLLQGSVVLDTARVAGSGYYLYKGDLEGLALVLASKGAGVASKKISEQLLTNPRFQNLLVKGLHAIKTESPKALKSANEAINKLFEDEGIDVKI